MRNACEKTKALMPDVPIDGEMQFDAATSPVVARTKHREGPVGGHANTFIFPDINAGNIGYKIAQRLGGFDAYGPILLGLNAPINDLSRGCNAFEVYSMAIITAALAYGTIPTNSTTPLSGERGDFIFPLHLQSRPISDTIIMYYFGYCVYLSGSANRKRKHQWKN